MAENNLRAILGSWLTLIVICIVLVFAGAGWALSSIDSIFSYRSPLKESPPAPVVRPGSPAARQIVFVLIDALRYDTSLDEAVMPNLNRLRAQGASARMESRPPSYSQPGYSTLLTGAWPDLNDGPVVNEEYANIWSFTQDNLFSEARNSGLKTAISGYDWFERLVPQAAVTSSFYTKGEDNAADRAVVDAALPWIKKGEYSLILIHIDQVDYAGHHEGGPLDPHWNQASTRADELLGEIVAAMDLRRDILFVCSDHGQIDRGGHGGQDPITLVEPFVLVGKAIRPGNYANVKMVDVAPTLAALLGSGLPSVSQGVPLTPMIDLPPEWALLNKTAAEKQHAVLLQAVQTALKAPNASSIEDAQSQQLAQGRAVRLGFVLVLLIVPAGLFFWLRPHGWPWLIGGALLAQVGFHLYYALIENRTYSLSSVDSQTQLVSSAVIGALLGLLLGGFLVVLTTLQRDAAQRAKESQVAKSVLILLLLTMYMQAWPVLVSFYWNGLNIPGALPEFGSAFLGVLSALQIVSTGLLGLLMVGVLALTARLLWRVSPSL
jgi:hypothetical protein